MSNKPLIEIAYDYVNHAGKEVSFKKLWAEVKKKANLSDEDEKKLIGQFYTSLSLDGRFVTLCDNDWDLRIRHTYDKVHIDTNEAYNDEEDKIDDQEEISEAKKEYEDSHFDNDSVEKDDDSDDINEEENSDSNQNY